MTCVLWIWRFVYVSPSFPNSACCRERKEHLKQDAALVACPNRFRSGIDIHFVHNSATAKKRESEGKSPVQNFHFLGSPVFVASQRISDVGGGKS